MRSRSRSLLAVIVALAVPLAGAGTASAAVVSALADRGAAGIGDPYFPRYGNGGYDVQHYSLLIRYAPGTDRLRGVARIRAIADSNLTQFNLDLLGLEVGSISVDGVEAGWSRWGRQELVVRPGSALLAGEAFTVVLRYAGVPEIVRIPGTAIRTGVVPTDDGAVIWGEPEVAATWFPVNDHPRDKATYDIDLQVPAGLQAVSNGRLQRKTSRGRWTTWHWVVRQPMASYLAVAAIGEFELRRRVTPGGIPIIDAVDPDLGSLADFALARQPRILRFLAGHFGPYPFDALGAIIDDTPINAALETQTRPIYDPLFFRGGGGTYVVVHELAHQWFGDHVAVDLWKHIWLNEGFATYAEWLWSGRTSRFTPERIFRQLCRIPPRDSFWQLKIGDPGPSRLFDAAVYYRGAMTLHAIRRAVGDGDFFTILRTWATEQGGATGTTAELLALAERISGRELDELFRAWLFTRGRPPSCNAAAARPDERIRVPPVPIPGGPALSGR